MDERHLGRIEGFLLAFERMNQLVNYTATFTFMHLGPDADFPRRLLEDALEQGGSRRLDGELLLEPVPGGLGGALPAIRAWLFNAWARDRAEQRLVENFTPAARLPPFDAEDVMDAFCELLEAGLERPLEHVWTIGKRTARGAALSLRGDAVWDGFVLAAGGQAYLLYLGWSD